MQAMRSISTEKVENGPKNISQSNYVGKYSTCYTLSTHKTLFNTEKNILLNINCINFMQVVELHLVFGSSVSQKPDVLEKS